MGPPVRNPDDRRGVHVEIDEGQAVTDRFLPGIRRLDVAICASFEQQRACDDARTARQGPGPDRHHRRRTADPSRRAAQSPPAAPQMRSARRVRASRTTRLRPSERRASSADRRFPSWQMRLWAVWLAGCQP